MTADDTPSPPPDEPCRVFVLRLEGKPGRGIHSLRALLKSLLRRHRLRCVELRVA